MADKICIIVPMLSQLSNNVTQIRQNEKSLKKEMLKVKLMNILYFYF